MFSRRGLVLGALASLPIASCRRDPVPVPSAPCGSTRTVITGGAVLDPDGRTFLRDRVVVVRDGLVAAVAPSTDFVGRPSDVVVDARGQFVVPGLVEAHGHPPDAEPDDAITMTEYLALCSSAGVTTVRSCRGTPAQLELRDRIAAGEIAGPRLLVGGLVEASTPSEGARIVLEVAKAGYDFVKLMWSEGTATYDAIAAAVRETKLPFCGHVPADVSLARAFAAGQSIEHLDAYRRELKAGASAQALAEATADADISVCPTETFVERWWQLAEPTRWDDVPETARVPEAQRERWRAWTRDRSIGPEERAAATAASELDRRVIAALHEAGANLLASASHGPWIVPGWSLHDELRIFERAGVPRRAALAAVTRTTAAFLPGTSPWGRIAAGHRADLVVIAADPLAELAALHRVAGVMTNGRWHGAS